MSKSSNVSVVTRIGAGVRLTEEAVPMVLATLPDGFDYTVRGAVSKAVIAWAVPAGTEVPAQKKGAAGSQVVTDFGRGVDTLTRAVKRALADSDDDKAVVLRASLTGAGSVVIAPDNPLYDAIVALIAGDAGE